MRVSIAGVHKNCPRKILTEAIQNGSPECCEFPDCMKIIRLVRDPKWFEKEKATLEKANFRCRLNKTVTSMDERKGST